MAQRVLEPSYNGLAKTEARTARYPKGGDHVVQRPHFYGLATMDYGLNPTPKGPQVPKVNLWPVS